MKKEKTRAITNEEFSVEFGDINGTKLYELPFATKKNHKKSSTNKK